MWVMGGAGGPFGAAPGGGVAAGLAGSAGDPVFLRKSRVGGQSSRDRDGGTQKGPAFDGYHGHLLPMRAARELLRRGSEISSGWFQTLARRAESVLVLQPS